eukprot:m.315510 g.315510  ORF g.315510 m.315510 type:complete len:761 (-) comp55441_c0_seq2:227-2509(-)
MRSIASEAVRFVSSRIFTVRNIVAFGVVSLIYIALIMKCGNNTFATAPIQSLPLDTEELQQSAHERRVVGGTAPDAKPGRHEARSVQVTGNFLELRNLEIQRIRESLARQADVELSQRNSKVDIQDAHDALFADGKRDSPLPPDKVLQIFEEQKRRSALQDGRAIDAVVGQEPLHIDEGLPVLRTVDAGVLAQRRSARGRSSRNSKKKPTSIKAPIINLSSLPDWSTPSLLRCQAADATSSPRLPAITPAKSIWPEPAFLKMGTATEVLRAGLFQFVYEFHTKDTPIMQAALKRFCSQVFTASSFKEPRSGASVEKLHIIVQHFDTPLDFGADESYALYVGNPIAVLNATTLWGALRGLQTFAQMVGTSDSASASIINLPVLVRDRPNFSWRGVLLDSSRHFTSLEHIHQILDGMEMTKLNVLHWHLTDYQAFTICSEKFPKLCQFGPYVPQKDNSYSLETLRGVVAYARDRGIRIVPEIDVPGHSASWAIEPGIYVNCTEFFGLLDPTHPKTMELVLGVLSEVASVFPDKYLHVGADECHFECWSESKSAVLWMAEHDDFSGVQLYAKFQNEVFDHVKSLGKKPMVWEDLFVAGVPVPKDVLLQPWMCWGMDMCRGGDLLWQGFNIVQSTCYYLDWDKTWQDIYDNPLLPRECRRLVDAEKSSVYGAETSLWTERIDATNLMCRTWPRVAAFAERVWSLAITDYQTRATEETRVRLKHFQSRLAALSIQGSPIDDLSDRGYCDLLPESQSTHLFRKPTS